MNEENAAVGFVGLGAMGGRIVERLMAAGHRVIGWNRSEAKAEALAERGMGRAATPREVAERSQVVLSMVTDTEAVEQIARKARTGSSRACGRGRCGPT